MLTLAAFPSHVETLSRELRELTALFEEPTRTARRLWPTPLEQNSGLATESTTCHLPEKAEELLSCMLRLSVANFLFPAVLKIFLKPVLLKNKLC